MKINLHISGRGYHLAAQAPASLELADGATVLEAIAQLRKLLPNPQSLPASCLVILAGKHLGTLSRLTDAPLHDGDELLLLAPVAGG